MRKTRYSEADLRTIEALGTDALVNHALFGDTHLQTDEGVKEIIRKNFASRKLTQPPPGIEPLAQDVVDGIRRCVQILARDIEPANRRKLAESAERFIALGKIPNLRPDQLASLFYPDDSSKAENMRVSIKAALASGALPFSTDECGPLLQPSHLAAWAECPKMPLNSPLLFWLPKGMHAAPESQDTTPSPAPAVTEIDFTKLATRGALIAAFGYSTGMDKSWFDNLKDAPKLMAARKVTGQGGRGHITEPWFCPYEVMLWLSDSKRKKGHKLTESKAWGLLEMHFPTVYNARSIGDPRTPD